MILKQRRRETRWLRCDKFAFCHTMYLLRVFGGEYLGCRYPESANISNLTLCSWYLMFRYPLSIFREIIMKTVVYGKFLAFTMSGSCNTLINCLISADAWMWNRIWCRQRLINNLCMNLLDFSWPRLTENFAMESPKLLHILTTHAAHMNIQWDMEECKCPQVWTAVHRVMPGNWEGGSLIALRQMHTIGRMVVIDTTQGIAGYLLLWKFLFLILRIVLRIVMRFNLLVIKLRISSTCYTTAMKTC